MGDEQTRVVDDARFTLGLEDFNAGNYFEAHEAWESVWDELVGAEKQLCQGLVQVAAGYHKLSLGVAGGARKLLERGLRLLRVAGGDRHELNLSEFCAGVEDDLRRLQQPGGDAGADLSLVRVPTLRRQINR